MHVGICPISVHIVMQVPYSRRLALHSFSVLLSTSGRLTEKFTLTYAKPWHSYWNVRGSPKPELC